MTTTSPPHPHTAGLAEERSCLVRIFNITTNQRQKRPSYSLRWEVSGRRFHRTYATRKLADTARAELLTATRAGHPFSTRTGLPASLDTAPVLPSWYEHACAFVDMKWVRAAPRYRKSIADALATVTLALLTPGARPPDQLRTILYRCAFNTTTRTTESDPDTIAVLDWARTHTLTLDQLADPIIIRRALDALASTLDGRPAAAVTCARRRAVFHNALRYAVELGHLPANPLDAVHWTAPRHTDTIDRRVVVNPTQARALLAAVADIYPALEAYYACLYYAGLRPAEATHLRDTDCKLPDTGWGELLLTGSTQQSGRAWNGTGKSTEDRALKHRAANDTRVVAACPDLVTTLRHHIETYGIAPNGRLFPTRYGLFGRVAAGPFCGPVGTSTIERTWQRARTRALTPDQVASPLAKRPYDLRHACLSTWLNAGVPATQVAEWAGHSVHVLLRVYAKCVHGQHTDAQARITDALHPNQPTTP